MPWDRPAAILPAPHTFPACRRSRHFVGAMSRDWRVNRHGWVQVRARGVAGCASVEVQICSAKWGRSVVVRVASGSVLLRSTLFQGGWRDIG